MTTINTIKARITKLRDILSLSQREFSDQIGITQGALSQLESGKSKLALDTTLKITQTFDVNCNWLLNGSGETFLDGSATGQEMTSGQSKETGLIPLINEEARAGYLKNFDNTDYIGTLDVYKIPGYEQGNYRMFEIEGDSMVPTIYPREIVIVEKVEDITNIENGSLCVVITEDGIVAKRTYLSAKDAPTIVLKSDNAKYKTYAVDIDDVREVWEIRAKITSVFAQEQLINVQKIDSLESDIEKLKEQMSDVVALTEKNNTN